MREKVLLQPTYILHSRPYRNTSLLLECLSLDHGRLTIVARGARAPRFKAKGLLQPFYPLSISWGGYGDLAYLNQVEANGISHALKELCLASGFYLNELLVRLLRARDPCADTFINYEKTLLALSASNTQPELEIALRLFEKKLLTSLGYGLNCVTDAFSGEPIEANDFYKYISEKGFQKKLPLPLAGEGWGEGGVVFQGQSLLTLASEDFSEVTPAQLLDLKRLMRLVLRVYLGPKMINARTLYVAKPDLVGS